MDTGLRVALGQHSSPGRKATNQDFHGAQIPAEPLLSSKGICVALADGISSSGVSQVASESAVKSFLNDYYCTSEAWSVRTAGERVLRATNAWLHAQTQASPFRYDKDRGYVCTFSAMVLKSATAHLFHAGDARIYRVRGGRLEQLTEDHRIRLSDERSYLGRALGVHATIEIDYRSVPIESGSQFLFATDGVYEFLSEQEVLAVLAECGADLDGAAAALVARAYDNGSDDNLTVQIVRVEALPEHDAVEVVRDFAELPFAPELEPGMSFDGYRIVRRLHASHRSHVYLAVDEESGAKLVLKTPSVDMREDPAYLERFLMEEWVGRRIRSPHVLRPLAQTRKRNFVYLTAEYVDGQTLAQWAIDHPKPDLETVRGIVEQIAKGLQAFHRQDMIHQDLRPENVLIDATGTLKIIDFGSVYVHGIAELHAEPPPHEILGTPQYTAPEYFLGELGTPQSDLFSLGVIAYQLLSGGLPYGTRVASARSREAQRRLVYAPLCNGERDLPAWVDEALRKAVHPNPEKRYVELSELVYDLRRPSRAFLSRARPPLLERNPAGFWKGVSLILAVIIVLLLLRG